MRNSTRHWIRPFPRGPAQSSAARAFDLPRLCLGLLAIAVLLSVNLLAPTTSLNGRAYSVATIGASGESDETLERPSATDLPHAVRSSGLRIRGAVVRPHVVFVAAVAAWLLLDLASVRSPGWRVPVPNLFLGPRLRARLQVYLI